MLIALPRFIATRSLTLKPQNRILILCRLPLLLALALCLSGCQARPVAPATPITPARSLTGSSTAIEHLQSSLLYRQARQDCAKHDYLHAADLLQTLARTPNLAPEAVAFVQQQRDLCLKDAGAIPAAAPAVAAPTLARLPALTASDADCGPRALLLVCQQIGIRTNLETLRKTAGTTAAGTTLAGLQQAAQKLGLQAEGVQVSREALPDVSLPAIAWDRRQHFIVLTALHGSGEEGVATIRDPNHRQEEKLSQESLLQRCGGYLLLVHR